MTTRNSVRPTNCFPAGKVAHVVQRCGLAITGVLCGLFVVAHLAKANVDVFDSVGLVFAMIRFGIIGFHLGNDIAPLSRKARIGVSPKADVIEIYNSAGAFLATVAAMVSVYVVVFDEVLPAVWVAIVALCWSFGVTMQIIVRLRVRTTLGRRKTSRDCHTTDGWGADDGASTYSKQCQSGIQSGVANAERGLGDAI
jgi:hypothetical protein